MSKASPIIPRWQLGQELRRLREAADLSLLDVARVLGCSDSKIRKIENGDVGVARLELLGMLDSYGVTEAARRDPLLALGELGKGRGWWVKYGQLPYPFASYVGLETAANSLRTFELAVIPGLLQTEDYARAVNAATLFGERAAEAGRQAELRMARQERLTAAENPLELWAIIDEAAIRREMGGSAVLRTQLLRLVEMNELPNVNIQVLPFSHGGHPGTLGPFVILEFPADMRSPVVFVEGVTGPSCLDSEEHLTRCNLMYQHMIAAALSVKESMKMLTEAAAHLRD